MKKVELLAPAGNLQALKAAVENGADAVYLGGLMFSARKNADNFDEQALAEGIAYAHQRQVKIYAAVNTLIHNHEIGDLLEYAYQLASAGIDAAIIQDLGAAHLLNETLPELRLHASTQMAVHNSAGVRYLKELGFKRAVLARETSLKDIKNIIDQDILEIETFVHGALCVAYSGQCLMSSMIGGRSGNRGQCAQPCRMKYTLVDEKGRSINHQADGDHLLSTRDLNMLHHVPQLIEAGIVSLKIEGRMKRPEYVATMVKYYREAIDQYYGQGRLQSSADQDIRQIFNRDFTTGYYFGKPGRDLMSYVRPDNRGIRLGTIEHLSQRKLRILLQEPLQVGDGYLVLGSNGEEIAGKVNELYADGKKVTSASKGQRVELILSNRPHDAKSIFKTSDSLLLKQALDSFHKPSAIEKEALHFHFTALLGQPLLLKAWDEQGNMAEATSDYLVAAAEKHPSDWESIGKQLGRLGNTNYVMGRLEGELGEGIMVPASELNKLRRDVIEQLQQLTTVESAQTIESYAEFIDNAGDLLDRIPPKMVGFSDHQLSVAVSSLSGIKAAVDHGADLVLASMNALRQQEAPLSVEELPQAADYCHQHGCKILITVAPIQYEQQLQNVEMIYQAAQAAGFDGVLAANAGTFQLARELGWDNIALDYPMNIFNDVAIQRLSDLEISQITLSPELNLAQINDVSYIGNLPTEVIVHGNFPLMVSEQCIVGSVLGGRSTKSSCSMPCKKGQYGLKDRLGMDFPLKMDNQCRMYVYNCKTLNIFKRLQEVLDTGIDIIRIEARERDDSWLVTVVDIYRKALDQYIAEGKVRSNEADSLRLETLNPEGSTYGHYFRGVQ